MCDRVRAAPEPGLSGQHRPEPGSRGSEKYTVITDICINDISFTQQQHNFLSELCFENGDWILCEALGHTQELRGVTTAH